MNDQKIEALTPIAIAVISGAIAVASLYSPHPKEGLAVAGIGIGGACGLARTSKSG